jgi:hypothetical protein
MILNDFKAIYPGYTPGIGRVYGTRGFLVSKLKNEHIFTLSLMRTSSACFLAYLVATMRGVLPSIVFSFTAIEGCLEIAHVK